MINDSEMVNISVRRELFVSRLSSQFDSAAWMFARLPAQLFNYFDSCATLTETKQLHAVLTTAGVSPHPPLTTNLLRSYAANDDILSARLLFDQTPHRTTYLWNSIIRAHARSRDFSVAFSLFAQMRSSGATPDSYTFACILRACSDNSDPYGARTTHGVMMTTGLSSDRIAGSALVTAYSRLGLAGDAANVFDGMPDPDLVLWNSMISGCARGGLWWEGVEMFRRMRRSGERPDGYSLVGVMSCLWDPSMIRAARGIHGLCVKGGCDSSAHVGSALVSMYSRCGCLDSGCRVFRALSRADLVTWSALISCLSKAGKCKEALGLFREMSSSGRTPDPVLIASVLSACASLAALGPGKEIHGYIIRLGISIDVAVTCALVDLYGKCGFLELGFRVFRAMQKKSLIAYNTVLSGLASHGFGREAICFFEELLNEGFIPDEATFSSVLCACCHSRLLEDGSELFKRMKCEFSIEAQMEHYVYMVKLLGSVGKVGEAYDLIQTMPMLPDSGVWGALLWSCYDHGQLDLGEIAAQRLLEIDPSKTAYRVMLSNIYATKEKWGNAETLRHDMKQESMQKIPGISWIDCNI